MVNLCLLFLWIPQKILEKEKTTMNPRMSELIKELSRLKYGKDVNVIEQVIGERAQL